MLLTLDKLIKPKAVKMPVRYSLYRRLDSGRYERVANTSYTAPIVWDVFLERLKQDSSLYIRPIKDSEVTAQFIRSH